MLCYVSHMGHIFRKSKYDGQTLPSAFLWYFGPPFFPLFFIEPTKCCPAG